MPIVSHDDFQVLHINIRSIPRNFNELVSYIQKQDIIYHVILITETWLTESDGDLYHIPSYCHISVTRPQKKGGGIRMYYLEDIIIDPCNLLTGIFASHEALFVKISLKSSLSLTIGCIYRPPSASIVSFNEYLSTLFVEGQLRGKCIIMGDFNIDFLKVQNSISFRNFKDIMSENGYIMLINSPTRCSAQDGIATSIIDHAWVNFYKDISADVLDYLIADHLPIKVKIKMHIQKSLKKLSFRIFSDHQFEIFDNDKNNLFNQYTISSNNVDLEVIKFEAWIQKMLDNYFPIKTKFLSSKRIKMPWLNNDVIQLITKKHKMFRALKNGLISYRTFKAYAKLLSLLLDRLRTLYFQRKFISCQNDSGKMWKSINNILGKPKKKSMVNTIKNSDGLVIEDKEHIAIEFNKYFNTIPTVTQSKLSPSLHNYDHLIEINNQSMFMRPSTANEVVKVISNLPNKSSSKGLSINFLKYVKCEIAGILCKLFNLCLTQGAYPESLKIARIIPLYKSGGTGVLTNYRPISLLPIINKIFEKMLYVRLDNFFDLCNIIS